MFVKRVIDLAGGILGLIVSLPVILLFSLLIFLQDRENPFYVSVRIGQYGQPFRMIKLRSMEPDSDRSGVNTVIKGNPQVTAVGRVIRATKIDELPQFFHVVMGMMSLVGPRPNIPAGVALYTEAERGLLLTKPGITDFSSIAFRNLDNLLEDQPDANMAYNQLIRPWKSQLGILYVQNRSVKVDLVCIALTGLLLISERQAKLGLGRLLRKMGAEEELVGIVEGTRPLRKAQPPN